MSVGKDWASERYQELQRLGWGIESDHVPVSAPHWEADMRTLTQDDDDWLLYVDGQETAQILVEENTDKWVIDLQEVR